MSFVRRLIRPLCTGALAMTAMAMASAAPVLVVDSLDGSVTGNLLGEARPLVAGDVIREREVLQTGPGARLSLVFARHGLLELGADARLAIEKLPDADDARASRSLVSLERGYLRVLWTPTPERAAQRPFVLFYGGHRSTLQPGEYFFERTAERLRSCVAAGHLTVSAIAGDDIEQLDADACYDLALAEPARRTAHAQTHWEFVRREFTTEPRRLKPPAAAPAPVAVARAAPAVAPAPVPVPLPTSARAPVAKPAPAPSATAVAAGWTLLLGSYADPGNAAQVAAKLRDAGYTPFTRIKDIDGRTWHSVQVRGLPSREVAEAKAAEVRAQLRIDAVKVVLLP